MHVPCSFQPLPECQAAPQYSWEHMHPLCHWHRLLSLGPHLLADSLESWGSCRELVPEPQPSQQQPLCGWIIFPHLVNCACAIWSMQTALSSIQPHFVEIVVYLHRQLSHDTIWFVSLMNQRKPGPDSQLVKINMTKVK